MNKIKLNHKQTLVLNWLKEQDGYFVDTIIELEGCYDYVPLEIFEKWDNFSGLERAQILKEYIDYLLNKELY